MKAACSSLSASVFPVWTDGRSFFDPFTRIIQIRQSGHEMAHMVRIKLPKEFLDETSMDGYILSCYMERYQTSNSMRAQAGIAAVKNFCNISVMIYAIIGDAVLL